MENGSWLRLVDYLKYKIRCECGTETDSSYPVEIVLSKENLLHITGSQDTSGKFNVEQYATKTGYTVVISPDGQMYRFTRTP